jgi:glycosyltransferase involved in cell wall biosynthesis
MVTNISVVIPVHNECKNVSILHKQILDVMRGLDWKFEIIFVDDGSTDGTTEELLKLKPVKVIRFRKNFGQSAALDAGFEAAKGDVIVTLDGDLQNDPADIPVLVKKLAQGYDAVSGWRKNRRDKPGKVISSRLAWLMRRVLLGTELHDFGCSMKAYRREALKEIELMGEMHRYLPALLEWKGFKIGEVVVNHHSRKFGRTKYNSTRLLKGFVDMLAVLFWRQYSSKPLHVFGGLGIILMVNGFALGSTLVILRFTIHRPLGSILALLAVLLVILGGQFFASGLLADISVKNYYKNGRKAYSVKEVHG